MSLNWWTYFIFSGKKKNPSMYRRPSELGLSTQRMEDKSEVRRWRYFEIIESELCCVQLGCWRYRVFHNFCCKICMLFRKSVTLEFLVQGNLTHWIKCIPCQLWLIKEMMLTYLQSPQQSAIIRIVSTWFSVSSCLRLEFELWYRGFHINICPEI